MNENDLINQSNAQQMEIYIEKARVSGTVVKKKAYQSFKQPVVLAQGDGMVSLTQITREHQKSSTYQRNFLAKPQMQMVIDEMMSKGIRREDCVCVVQTMDCSPRNGAAHNTPLYLCGGTFAHPLIARIYRRYIACDPLCWREVVGFDPHKQVLDTPAEPVTTTQPTTDQTSQQISPFKPSTPPTPTITPPKPQKPTTDPNQAQNKELWDALKELVSIYGAQNMVDRLDDVIFTYTESMMGRGDLHTMETINCLRTIRDAFRIDDLLRKIA